MDAITIILQERLTQLEARLRTACVRAGRARGEVTLVAVTKSVSAATAARFPELGVADLGENRPQELWSKAAQLPRGVRWHLIGHLQRNKVERTLPLAHLIHSVDSLRLLEAVNAAAARQSVPAAVLLEVNASREPNKHGFALEEVPAVLARLPEFPSLAVQGFMTMAAWAEDPEAARPTFAAVRALREQWQAQVPFPHTLRELSMGMTNDFEVAIEEGATLVRIGSALLEGLPEDPREAERPR